MLKPESNRRGARRTAMVAAAVLLIGACGGSDDTAGVVESSTSSTAVTSESTSSPSTDGTAVGGDPLHLVVLGDSIAIPSMGCGDCVGFDERYRTRLEQATGRPVVLDNEARPEFQIADLSALLDSDDTVRALVAEADVVVVSIGYNNGPPWTPDTACHPIEPHVDTDLLIALRDFDDACIAATNEEFRDDFEAVYAGIEELAAGRPQVRIDLGNFNNLLGNPGGDGTLPAVWAGEDAPGFPQSDLPKAIANMSTASAGYTAVECETATAHGFVCAGLLEAFNGPDGSASLAEYVNPADFVHPNEAGQQRIFELLEKIDLGPLDGAATDGEALELPASPVVFQRSGGIQVLPPDGSSPLALASEVPAGQEHPDWSRDGRRVVFDVGFSELWTVNADGSDATKLFTCTAPCRSLQDASWSPDGTEVAFMVAESIDGTTTSRSAVVALDVTTGALRTIYEDTTGTVWLFHPRWSGDGGSIVLEVDTFASDRLDEEEVTSIAVAVVAASGGATTLKYLVTLTGPFDGPGAPAPDWSPVDDLIVFSREDNLFTVRPDGTDESTVTEFGTTRQHAIQPTFTPDGAAIIFTLVTGTYGVDDSPTAAVVGLDGSGPLALDGGGEMTHPRVQP